MDIADTPMGAKPPSLTKLNFLLANGLAEEALSLIKKFKLPYALAPDNSEFVDANDIIGQWLKRLVTVDLKMLELKEDIKKLATAPDDTDQLFTVLVCGETGTGKELIARALHGNRKGEFVAINCAGMPESLVESILFGYMQGAFTGANRNTPGLFRQAEGGTVFLDEIGEMPLTTQAKLLRTIQDKKIRRVGALGEETVDCRVVCATHRDLAKMVTEDKFRLDLFARISTYELFTIPLKDRLCDIVPILSSISGGTELLKAIDNNIGKLMSNDGLKFNVRSLQQMVKRYKMFGRIDHITNK